MKTIESEERQNQIGSPFTNHAKIILFHEKIKNHFYKKKHNEKKNFQTGNQFFSLTISTNIVMFNILFFFNVVKFFYYVNGNQDGNKNIIGVNY